MGISYITAQNTENQIVLIDQDSLGCKMNKFFFMNKG